MNLNSIVLSNLRTLFLSSLSACYLKKLAITGNYRRAMSSLTFEPNLYAPHTYSSGCIRRSVESPVLRKTTYNFEVQQVTRAKVLFFFDHSRDETITDDNLQAFKRVR